jgi:hypothetical protein
MGYYINPTNGTKEAWLNQYGMLITMADAKLYKAGAKVVVCLVDNGMFTAAGIAYDDRERDAFAIPDGRRKKWYLVRRTLLVRDGFLDS